MTRMIVVGQSVFLASLLSGCILLDVLEDEDPTDSPPDAPPVDTGTPMGIEDGVLPAVLRDADIALPDRIEDPSMPDYVAEDGLEVQITLTIEPGVVIAFGDDTRLLVDGRAGGVLDAVGTEAAPIVFTHSRQEPGAWGGIYVDNVEASLNRLDYVTVEYGGGQDFGAGLGASNLGVGGFVGNGQIEVTNSTFRNSAGHGIEVEVQSTLDGFGGNTFGSNAGFDLRIGGDVLASIDETNAISPQGIQVVGGDMLRRGTWVDHGVPVQFEETFAVHADLTIDPGVVLQFGDNVGLIVDGRADGTIAVQGTVDEPVVFEGQDGVSWRGLWIDNTLSSRNAIAFAEFSDGGFEAYETFAAQLTIGGFVGTSTISVRDCTFTNAAANAFDVAVQSDATINADLPSANSFTAGVVDF